MKVEHSRNNFWLLKVVVVVVVPLNDKVNVSRFVIIFKMIWDKNFFWWMHFMQLFYFFYLLEWIKILLQSSLVLQQTYFKFYFRFATLRQNERYPRLNCGANIFFLIFFLWRKYFQTEATKVWPMIPNDVARLKSKLEL